MNYRRTLYIACVFLCLLSPECYSREAMATTTSGIKDSGVFLLASWYSSDSLIKEGTRKPDERQVMANGEQFKDNGLTAASWDYPLNSMVKVTNLDNGRSVVVKITDRTARRFKGKRIDLSAGAFQRLSGLEKGLIKVEVNPI